HKQTPKQTPLRDVSAARKAGRVGGVQPREENRGDQIVAFQCLKELTGKLERDYLQGPGVPEKGEWVKIARGQGWLGYWEGIVPCEGGEALAQGAQRICGCPWIPGNVQDQVGWDLEHPGTVDKFSRHFQSQTRSIKKGEILNPTT
uniref:Uncharacterized protein n=1 Tax=Malurus cyaneus samueli TaxID=2593467 RepID=A0A8C5UAZ6_9PASS